MPFRRKNRHPLFGSSRSGDKENANFESMQEPLLQSQPTGLFRSHSDNSQRFCCDINPNTMGAAPQHNRNGVLSTKEKMSNLLQLNATLVKEVASLRASQLSLTMNMEELSEQLQTKSITANTLETEKKELAEEISQLGKAHLSAKESLLNEKKDVEDRLECVSLVVDNLQNMNGVLAEEAARLRVDADRYATEKQTLLADLDTILGEKSILEELVNSFRASEEAFRTEMQQALNVAEIEKKTLCEEKQILLREKSRVLVENEELQKEVLKLGMEKATLHSQEKELVTKKKELEGELSIVVSKNCEAMAQLMAERQASANATSKFDAEKRALLANCTELENSLAELRKERQHASEQFKAERQLLQQEAERLASQNVLLTRKKEELQHQLDSSEKIIKAMQLHETEQQEELSMLQGELDNSQLKIEGLLAQDKVQQDELCKLQRELLLTSNAAKESQLQAEASFSKTAKEKDDIILMLQSRVHAADNTIEILNGEHEAWKDKERKLQSNILALECKLSTACKSFDEAIAEAAQKGDKACILEQKLDKASQTITSLEGKLAAGKDKETCLEVQIQTMRGDLLIAEDAAIQAYNKAKDIEKEAGNAIERKTREASQKMGALEGKLAAMVERQSDLENHIRVKENACRAALQAENTAKARMNGLLGGIHERGEAMEGHFELLKAAMLAIQNNAMRANQGITSLQEEIMAMMDVKANWMSGNGSGKGGRKRRGRSRSAKVAHHQSCREKS